MSVSNLEVRLATTKDIPGINEVVKRSYGAAYPEDMLRGQVTNFPEGHFVAQIDDQIVGYCASIVVPEKKALAKHSWREITGNGFGTTHKADGDYLYGYEVCVDPDYRRYRIAQRFYKERKKLCRDLNLKGIVFAGRLSNLAKKIKQVGSAEDYIEAVLEKKLRDPVINFQIRQGFEIIGILKDYLPNDKYSLRHDLHDKDSLGYGLHLLWKNPRYQAPATNAGGGSIRVQSTVRVATVQYMQRRIKSFEEFKNYVEYFVDVVSDYRSDFVVFPELFALQLLSIENNEMPPHESIKSIAKYQNQLIEMFQTLAVRFNVNIIGGSHPVIINDQVQNVCHIFLRDGTVYQQPKIHPTPNEAYWWNIVGGDTVQVIPTDCGPIGVLICYDSEFPELARHLVNQGAMMLFVPFLTDERQSYCRVRYCAQARAVENQVFVVLSGCCGNLPGVNNIDIHYSQSCILTPCDFPFARDGIAADTTPNVETVAFADLNINNLKAAREHGTVRNLHDRRHDLYSIAWHGK